MKVIKCWLFSNFQTKVSFTHRCTSNRSHSKNLTSLSVCIHYLGRLKWIRDIIWPLNQHFKLKTQRNWLKQVWMLNFWSVINCFFMHWTKKLTLVWDGWSVYSSWIYFTFITKKMLTAGLIFNDFGPQGKLLESMLNCWT